MGVGDVKDHVLSKVLPGTTQADKIKFATKGGVCGIFFLIFLIGVFSSSAINGDIMISQLIVNGTSQDGSAGVHYPQMTFCPLWKQGVIEEINCYQVQEGKKGHDMKKEAKPAALLSKTLMAGHYKDEGYPDWDCHSFNFDGKQIKSADHEVWCEIKSHNHGAPNKGGMVYDWPGRVRLYVDTPGTLAFEHCEDCVDGIDGAVLVANTTSFVFWQAHLIDDTGLDFHNLNIDTTDLLTEYRSVHTALPIPEVFDAKFDMGVAMGFYSKDVWRYTSPGNTDAPIGAARFVEFWVFWGGFLFAAFLCYSCVSTTLILLLLGKDQLDSETKGYESAPIL